MIKINTAIEFMKKCHEGQKDKAGMPYYIHPLSVYTNVCELTIDDNIKIASLLHDVVEDCDITCETLMDMGYSYKTVEIIKLLTKKEGQNNKQYIDNIIESNNIGAIIVKACDIKHNLDPDRLNTLNPITRAYLENKYIPIFKRLRKIINKHFIK